MEQLGNQCQLEGKEPTLCSSVPPEGMYNVPCAQGWEREAPGEEIKLLCLFCQPVSGRSEYRPGQCGAVAWVASCKAKGHQLDSRSGRMPRL